MNVSGGTLTEAQENAWKSAYPDEYNHYVAEGLYDPDSNEIYEIPDWMDNGDPSDGPFDFSVNKSHGTSGW